MSVVSSSSNATKRKHVGRVRRGRAVPNVPSYRGILGKPIKSINGPSKSCALLLSEIRRTADRAKDLTTSDIQAEVADLQKKIQHQQRKDNRVSPQTTVQCFGLATEALRRTRGLVYYDVQLIAGLTLAAGTVAEIQTGEGKTITTALPAILHCLAGRGVHVATTNDYLSRRDFEELKPVFAELGFSAGLLRPQASPTDRMEAYACDVTYGPGYEFGFDFLKDQLTLRSRGSEPLGFEYLSALRGLKLRKTPLMQRGHWQAIVDEADSVLIDEATTPLILSGPSSNSGTAPDLYRFARKVALEMSEGNDFDLDRKNQKVSLTDWGIKSAYESFQLRPKGPMARQWTHLIESALKAEHLLRRDEQYVVTDGAVHIVDPNTGRIHEERTWSAGLHQAVEAKEGVELTPENRTQARITRQRFSNFYQGICGLTGTAKGASQELLEFYGLPVVPIPTNKPSLRRQLPTRSFKDHKSKFAGIVNTVSELLSAGRPILIGTRTIRESHLLAQAFTKSGIEHQVLNGVQDREEADIVSRAGESRRVTVATNMAGRGTDIRLDEASLQAGGLHVIATEYNNSARVDRQLAGRAARQGDPGSCQFFASAEDELFANFAPHLAKHIERNSDSHGECHDNLEKSIQAVQAQVERGLQTVRRDMVAHDRWLESVQSSLARRSSEEN